MHVLQLSPVDIHPPSRGGEHRTHGLMLSLPEQGFEVVRLAQGGLLSNHDAIDGEISRQVTISDDYIEIRPLNPLHDVVRLPTLLNIPGLLFIAADRLFWRTRTVRGLLDWADIILVEGPWQVPPVLRAQPDARVVYSSHNVETDRLLLSEGHPLFGWSRRRVSSIESTAVTECDAVVCTSRADAFRLEELYGTPESVVVVPNATYAHRLRSEIDTDGVREQYDIPVDAPLGVFLGSDYGPNNEAAAQLVELTSCIRDTVPGFETLLLGHCGRHIKDSPPGVTVAGFVENVDSHIAAADIAFNPVTRGSGSNIKMFDYLVHGVPVITTPFGAEGISLTHGENGIIAELSSFAEWAAELAAEPNLATSIGIAGRELVADRYTWERVSRILGEWLRVSSMNQR